MRPQYTAQLLDLAAAQVKTMLVLTGDFTTVANRDPHHRQALGPHYETLEAGEVYARNGYDPDSLEILIHIFAHPPGNVNHVKKELWINTRNRRYTLPLLYTGEDSPFRKRFDPERQSIRNLPEEMRSSLFELTALELYLAQENDGQIYYYDALARTLEAVKVSGQVIMADYSYHPGYPINDNPRQALLTIKHCTTLWSTACFTLEPHYGRHGCAIARPTPFQKPVQLPLFEKGALID